MDGTVKEYILSKPDDYRFEIIYRFANFCPECHKNIITIDEEYSSGINTAAEFKSDVEKNAECSHYRGYDFVYNDNYIGECELSVGDEGQETITITREGEEEICSECQEKEDKRAKGKANEYT